MSAALPMHSTSAVNQLTRPDRLLAAMADYWFRQFREHFGFPNNYTTIDLETTGTTQDTDLICTAGMVVVRDGRPEQIHHWVLNWPDSPGYANSHSNRTWLRRQLRKVQEALQARNQSFHHSYEYLRAEGREPGACLEEILNIVEAAEERNEIIVAHNGWWFDVEFLQAHFYNYLQIPYVFPDNGVYDTGICEKAAQLSDEHEPLPRPGETLKEFSWRIGAIRARGVYWALGGYCNERYGLLEKANVSPLSLHRADTDALVLHYLVQEHRRLAGMLDDG